MARGESEQPARGGELTAAQEPTPDPRVTDLEGKLAGSPGVVVFRGYVGTSGRAGFMRLYLTLELDEYVEIDLNDLLDHTTLESEKQPLPETVVWVKGNAKVEITCTDRREMQADFLKGDVASGAEGPGYSEALYKKKGSSSLCRASAWVYCSTVVTNIRACCDGPSSSLCTTRCG